MTVNHFTHKGEACSCLTFHSGSDSIDLYLPPRTSDALKEAWEKDLKGRLAAERARQMNAELSDDVQEVMEVKGMI